MMKRVEGSLAAATTYRLHQRVGRGGMAAVHLGTMVGPAGERRVAIKQLVADDALDVDARRRLIDEARLVFQLTHANICQVFDLASSADGTFVVMEFVEGLDLRALVKRAGPLELPHALYIAREVARALDYAHRRSDDAGRALLLVHGDVTPANVLVSCEGEVKLADFGISRALGHAPSPSFTIAGTPGFLAPELKKYRNSQRADLYALGMTLYVALTGKFPAGEGWTMPPLRQVRPDASADLEQLIVRATAPDPDARIASAAQLEQALALELARRFAEFTPSSLARVVRQHYQTASSAPPPGAASVLESMTVRYTHGAATVDLKPSHAVQSIARHTRTAPVPARSRRWVVMLAPTVLAATAIGAYEAWPSAAPARVPELAVTSVRAPAPDAAAPPPAPAPRPDPVPIAQPDPVPRAPDPVRHAPDPAPHAPGRPRHVAQHAPAPHVDKPEPAKVEKVEKTGFLTVTARSWGAVFVDDRQVAAQTPLYKLALGVGAHRVKIFQPASGSYSSVQDVEIRAGEVAQVSFK